MVVISTTPADTDVGVLHDDPQIALMLAARDVATICRGFNWTHPADSRLEREGLWYTTFMPVRVTQGTDLVKSGPQSALLLCFASLFYTRSSTMILLRNAASSCFLNDKSSLSSNDKRDH